MIKARYDKIEAEGRNSFMCQAVPAAVLKFQQGFGRLIRSETDRGMVVLLDRRVAVKKYGSIFTSSVEAPAKVVFQEEMMEREIDDFFGGENES
jgi:ATP-dependent DNA helicase DinG